MRGSSSHRDDETLVWKSIVLFCHTWMFQWRLIQCWPCGTTTEPYNSAGQMQEVSQEVWDQGWMDTTDMTEWNHLLAGEVPREGVELAAPDSHLIPEPLNSKKKEAQVCSAVIVESLTCCLKFMVLGTGGSSLIIIIISVGTLPNTHHLNCSLHPFRHSPLLHSYLHSSMCWV